MKSNQAAALTVILSVLMLMTGCGSLFKGSGEGQTNAEAFVQNEAEGDGFIIRVGAWFIDDRSIMAQFKQNVERAYKNKYPKAKIQWEVTLGENYTNKLITELESDSAPDVIFNQYYQSFTESGYLADLSSEAWTDKLIPQVKKTMTYAATENRFRPYDSKVFAAPMGMGVRGYWYNKDLFRQLGLEVPKNLGDLLAASETIKQSGIIPIALGFKDTWTVGQHFNNLLQSIGYGSDSNYGRSLHEGGKRLDGDEVQTTMQFFQTLKERQYINKNALTIDWMQSAELFTSGQAAIIMQGPWIGGTVEDNFAKGDKPFELGFFPVSDVNGYYDLLQFADQYISVNAKTSLMQQAKDLVAVILSPEVYEPYCKGNGYIPAFTDMKPVFGNPVMDEVIEYANRSDSHNRWELYVATPAYNELLAGVTRIVSGVEFNQGDLRLAQIELEKGKEWVNPPPE
ncbi:ABC transporter substrate-binding protein [Paenibacillus nasutitermitis]|uniref:ABC transporter extracellular-binding protein YurO n=1 Tax=Paenibacillus nasutitermitis TaxID=1652958 RepID=A0A916YR14_9BACL|nr:extracellular solute-binding protein [Paenibacillus nasutitermitis]GGD57202.1 putative ABC transporter extracellular-binding protein YurO [Paenibacillus nasutitermitis]